MAYRFLTILAVVSILTFVMAQPGLALRDGANGGQGDGSFPMPARNQGPGLGQAGPPIGVPVGPAVTGHEQPNRGVDNSPAMQGAQRLNPGNQIGARSGPALRSDAGMGRGQSGQRAPISVQPPQAPAPIQSQNGAHVPQTTGLHAAGQPNPAQANLAPPSQRSNTQAQGSFVQSQDPGFHSQNDTNGHTPVAICHRTGSQTNAWILITVDDDAVAAHLAHGDMLAIGGTCPTGSGNVLPTTTMSTNPGSTPLVVATPTLPSGMNGNDDKVGICHATGSASNPYVHIVVDRHAVQAHLNHQDGRDIIGVTGPQDCPGAGAVPPTVTLQALPTITQTPTFPELTLTAAIPTPTITQTLTARQLTATAVVPTPTLTIQTGGSQNVVICLPSGDGFTIISIDASQLASFVANGAVVFTGSNCANAVATATTVAGLPTPTIVASNSGGLPFPFPFPNRNVPPPPNNAMIPQQPIVPGPGFVPLPNPIPVHIPVGGSFGDFQIPAGGGLATIVSLPPQVTLPPQGQVTIPAGAFITLPQQPGMTFEVQVPIPAEVAGVQAAPAMLETPEIVPAIVEAPAAEPPMVQAPPDVAGVQAAPPRVSQPQPAQVPVRVLPSTGSPPVIPWAAGITLVLGASLWLLSLRKPRD